MFNLHLGLRVSLCSSHWSLCFFSCFLSIPHAQAAQSALGLRGHCPNSQPGKKSQAVRCTAGTAAEMDGEVRGCAYSPSPASGDPQFRVSAWPPAFLFFMNAFLHSDPLSVAYGRKEIALTH